MLGEANQLLYTEEGQPKDGLTFHPVLDAVEEYHTRLINMAKEVRGGREGEEGGREMDTKA